MKTKQKIPQIVLGFILIIVLLIHASLSNQELGDTQVHSNDGAVIVYVPGGTFQMGSTPEEVEVAFAQCEQYLGDDIHCQQRSVFEFELPLHSVTLDSFWIYQTEVTNAQYANCVEDEECSKSDCSDSSRYNGDNYPVVCISWQDAANYCAWAEARLPTEAEWEYVARGTERRTYSWGDTFDCTKGNFRNDATCEDDYRETAPVGSYPAGVSWCGALDMSGNVSEWVADRPTEYTTTTQTNPIGLGRKDLGPSFNSRVIRGGHWNSYGPLTRAAFRGYIPTDHHFPEIGFRCVVPKQP